jgi:hypothetical protein
VAQGSSTPETLPRVLHVVQVWSAPTGPWEADKSTDPCDAGVLACAACVEHALGFDQSVLVLGGTQAASRAAAFGLRRFDRIAPPLGRASQAARTFRRYVQERGPFDIVQLWGEGLLQLAPWNLDGPKVDIASLTQGDVVTSYGVDEDEEPTATQLPPVSLGLEDAARRLCERPGLRKSLGVRDEEIALVLLADPPDSGQVSHFMFLATLLRSTGLPVVPILNRQGRDSRRGLSLARRQVLQREPILVDDPLHHVLAACDIAVFGPGSRLCSPAEPSSWRAHCLTRTATVLGVPVVTATPGLVPKDVEHELLPHSRHPSAFARVIRRLGADRVALDAMRKRLAAMADDSPAELARTMDRHWLASLSLKPCSLA